MRFSVRRSLRVVVEDGLRGGPAGRAGRSLSREAEASSELRGGIARDTHELKLKLLIATTGVDAGDALRGASR